MLINKDDMANIKVYQSEKKIIRTKCYGAALQRYCTGFVPIKGAPLKGTLPICALIMVPHPWTKPYS